MRLVTAVPVHAFRHRKFYLAHGPAQRRRAVTGPPLIVTRSMADGRFRHHWTPHAIAMWDNRQTTHYAVHDYYPQRRYMERVTIKGGPVTGVPRAGADSVRKIKFAVPEGVDRHGGHKPH